MSDSAKLNFRGTEIDLPIIDGTENEAGLDISKLRSTTGAITLDNGYGNTGSCKSEITYLDGEKGILRYRGYAIEDLCEHSNFLETSYLLINGELPSIEQSADFEHSITHHSMLREDIKKYWDAWPHSAHPMATLSSVVSALSTFYEDSADPWSPKEVEITIHRLIAKMPTIAAFAYKKSVGQPKMYPNNRLSYSANFLQMMFSMPTEDYEVDPIIERALDQLLLLHMDHEQNCSTSTVRMVGSSHANLFASVAAGVCALWGPLHGGANQAVLEMLSNIHAEGGGIQKYIDKAKDKNDPFKLFGFGHRVYKNFDPRATIIKKLVDQVLEKLGVNDPLVALAKELEEKVLADSYFAERKLYPNVDFYSGVLYKAMGFPPKFFTVLFAIGRLPGWIAHWKEMIENPDTKIGRPRQIYTGANARSYKPISKR
ncbi:MAG: citrate synthase [SAR324 cluster bacterium]|nr:citrate synthase [SAR324 cluster bacterium]